jgi:ferritin-like metal-binding protein YciE
MEVDSLRKLYVEELKDLYSAEKQILQALPKMVKKATNPQLKNAFQEHLEVTQVHVERLERIFEGLGKPARGKKCKAMEGLLEEGKEMMAEDMEDDVMDAALISAAQRVEHYEMAGYGTVRTWAQEMGETAAAKLLQETLDEERNADKSLTQLAETTINIEAMAGV